MKLSVRRAYAYVECIVQSRAQELSPTLLMFIPTHTTQKIIYIYLPRSCFVFSPLPPHLSSARRLLSCLLLALARRSPSGRRARRATATAVPYAVYALTQGTARARRRANGRMSHGARTLPIMS
jgi:hypothetical protein